MATVHNVANDWKESSETGILIADEVVDLLFFALADILYAAGRRQKFFSTSTSLNSIIFYLYLLFKLKSKRLKDLLKEMLNDDVEFESNN